jgi:protein-disulfide isomerase
MNKKQHQREVREQKQALADKKAANQKKMILGGSVLLIAIIAFAVIRMMAISPPTVSEVVAGDHVKGNPDALVTLIEYSDLQCPACRAQNDVIAKAWPPIKNSVRFVYRHFPLTQTHPHALEASYYAEAAALQGKFWEMHDLMFAQQQQWSRLKDVTPVFDGFVANLGLDKEQFAKDVVSAAVKEKVATDLQSAKSARVAATPSFFLNGEPLTDIGTPDKLKEAIRLALIEAQKN